MLNTELKDFVTRFILPRVIQPAQYVGGELNMVRKDHRSVRGKLCMAFPDMYTIGMSHHGLQVLYTLMNSRDRLGLRTGLYAVARHGAALTRHRHAALQPGNIHAARTVRRAGLHAAIRNLHEQYPDDARPRRHSAAQRERTMEHPLIIAGGPCAQNPEPIAPFIDLFVTGDGEPSLPRSATNGCG